MPTRVRAVTTPPSRSSRESPELLPVSVIKSLWASVQGDPVFMRKVNGWLNLDSLVESARTQAREVDEQRLSAVADAFGGSQARETYEVE